MQTLAVCVMVLSLSVMALGWHVYRVTEALRRLQKRHRKLLRRTANAFDEVTADIHRAGRDLDHHEALIEQHRAAASRLFQQQAGYNHQIENAINMLASGGGKVIHGPWQK